MKGMTRYPIYALLATGLLLAALLVLTPHSISHADPRVLYAAPDGVASGNCDSWANACTLQYALSLAQSGDEIWVKKGVHYPGPSGDRTATFTLKNGVALYGGFAGTESSRDARNWQANPTVLSGDIDQNDITDANGVVTTTAHIRGDNAYHVVTAENVDSTAVLDGFVITAGKANVWDWPHYYGGGMYNSGDPTLTNVTFSGNYADNGGGMCNSGDPTLTNVTFSGNSANYGGGMYNSGDPTLTNVTFSGNSANYGGGMYSSGSPTLTNVTFSSNSANQYGGGMYNSYGNPTLTNVTFSGNSANYGGGMYISYSNPTLTNVTFSGNSANHGGGMYNSSGKPILTNAIMWGNTTDSEPDIYNSYYYPYYAPVISYSDIQGCGGSGNGWNTWCGIDGGGNIDTDPLFVDPANGDLRLQSGSPAINAGNDDAVPSAVATDLDGHPRFSGPAVDMGAYEYQETTPYYHLSVTLAGPGTGWVQSAPPRIACPGACRRGFEVGTQVVLTATPGATSQVAGWSGCDSVAGNTCTLTMNASRTVTVTFSHTPGVLYAAPTARGLGNCSNWTNACTLQTALSSAISGDEIWVEKGVHYPGTIRTATFRLKNGVAVYGGFSGTESSRDARNWQANPTVLSGDIDQNDTTDPNSVVTTTAHITGTNAYHVVTAENVDSTTILDGFFITAGKADGYGFYSSGGGMYNSGPLTLRNITFSGNKARSWGGGISTFFSPITLTNITFRGNSAGSGGGVSTYRGTLTMTNVTFMDNYASANGGGIFLNDAARMVLANGVFIRNCAGSSWAVGGGIANVVNSDMTLINVTFSGNSAGLYGGGIYNYDGSRASLTHVILWNNTAPTGPEIYSQEPWFSSEIISPTIAYSDIRGCGGSGSGWKLECGVDEGGNIDADPLFVNAAAGDLHLQPNSPAIDAGKEEMLPPTLTTDRDGHPRISRITVDMGAYEYQVTNYHRLSVALAGSGAGWVHSAPPRIACPDACQRGFEVGTRVVLTATPGATSQVAGWSGCDSIAGNTCTLTLNASRTVTVTFSHTPGVLYAAPTARGLGNCSNWANACTLQTALTSAASGDEIWVEEGVHYPGIGRTATFRLKSGVAIYGGFAGTESSRDVRNWQANPTVLSGDVDRNDTTDANGVVLTTTHIVGNNAYHVVTAENVDSTAVLDGFTITAGRANGSDSDSSGGGMYNSGGSPTLRNLTFSGNVAYQYGGGMYNKDGNPTLSRVTFSNNLAFSGGGMYNKGHPVLVNVVFNGNNSSVYGGGMYNENGHPTLTGVIFSSNSTQLGGGGGMYNSGGSPRLVNVAFNGNSARSAGCGGMANSGGILTLTNVVFSRNSGPGGGMCNYEVHLTLTNATFSGNFTQYGSCGGMCNTQSIITMTNTILWGNHSSVTDTEEIYNDGSTICTVSHSDIRGCGGSGSGWNIACGIDGGGNIDADPLFVNADAGDLHLQENSPAIDAGLNSAVPAGITSDLDGNPRFVDFTGRGTAIVDMGAYEVQRPLPYHIYLPLVMRNR